MIARVTGGLPADWTPDTEASLRQCAQYAAYGSDTEFLRFYQDDRGNRLSLLDGDAVLYTVDDPEEMFLFLTMDPTVHRVRTDAQTAKKLSEYWGTMYSCEVVMEAPAHAQHISAVHEIGLKDMYPVLKECFKDAVPPFDIWYADVHHRYRRGLCRAVGVSEQGKLSAVAMTVAECPEAALIGAVATLPAARSKGYASACVLSLSHMLQKENKRVVLSPKNVYAHRVYDRIGFRVVGEWGSVIKPTEKG